MSFYCVSSYIFAIMTLIALFFIKLEMLEVVYRWQLNLKQVFHNNTSSVPEQKMEDWHFCLFSQRLQVNTKERLFVKLFRPQSVAYD